jgi:hypothetical protein
MGNSVLKTVREAKLNDAVLRLVEKDKRYIGLVIADGVKAQIDGTDADDVWRRLHDEAARLNPKYVGFDGARNRFLHWFKGGFQSPNSLAGERGYKVDAKTKLESSVPLDDAAAGSGYGEAVLSVFRATNLLSPFEKVRLQDVLRGPNADSFILAAAQFTLMPSKSALLDLEHALKPDESRKMDGRVLLAISVAADRAHVSQAGSNERLCRTRRPPFCVRLPSAPRYRNLRQLARSCGADSRGVVRSQAARSNRHPKPDLGGRRLQGGQGTAQAVRGC